MHLGLKDIRFARGRFLLMAIVIALITFLLVMLTGLTSGLGNQSVSAVRDLKADRIIFSTTEAGASPSFTESQITSDVLDTYTSVYGSQVAPLGISAARAEGQLGTQGAAGTSTAGVANLALFGGSPALIPATHQVTDLANNSVYLDQETATTLGLITAAGDLAENAAITLNGTTHHVQGLSNPAWYSHMPVAWTNANTWAKVAHTPADIAGTVLTLSPNSVTSTQQLESVSSDTGTTALTPGKSVRALASYSSENGSLTMMQAFLYGISGLEIAAFVAVWTVQRTRDIAVLRALGAPSSYVVRDGLLQAFVVVLTGAAIGGTLGYGAAQLAAGVVPISVGWATIALPIVGIVALGTAAAYVAVRQASRVNPLLALGGN